MTSPTSMPPYLESPRPLAFAHRGGALHPDLLGLENTLTAFRHAAGLGFRYLETDVHTTSDGVLLAFHDEVLDRVTDLRGSVTAMTYDQVRRARIGGHNAVPTLAELFDELPDARFNIDLKSAGAVRALPHFLGEREAWDRVMVGSFSARRLAEFREITRGRVATSAHAGEVAAYRFSPTAVLARRLTPGRPRALQVPHRAGPLVVVTEGLVERAHVNGLHVHVWTIDDAEEMNILLDRGVDGIMTDRTDILRDVLRARGAWEEPTGGTADDA